MRKLLITAAMGLTMGLAVSATSFTAHAAGDRVKAPTQSWGFQGIFGKFDRPAIHRGSQIFFESCASCHSLNLMSYRNLVEIGMNEDFVKELAAEYEVEDGPDQEGDMFMRSARLSDGMVPPFANEKAARASNSGAFPPDLSLMTKARVGGPDYLYALLTGYKDEAPEGIELSDTTYYNTYFPGHRISMPPPMSEEMVEYEDGTPMTLEQHAKDIVVFLAWAAEPELEERKSLGIKVMLYLILLTSMLYALKRRIWSRICLDEYTHGPYVEEFQKDLDKHKLPG